MAVSSGRFRALAFGGLLAAALLAACGGGGSSGGMAPTGPTTSPTNPPTNAPPQAATIKHVVVIIQENRTVDNFFAGFPGADTQYPPHYVIDPLFSIWDPNHDYDAFIVDVKGEYPAQALAVVRRSDITPYWDMATSYGFADEVEQSSEGQTYPAHQYLIAGQAGRDAPGGTWTIAQNPFVTGHIVGGCNMAPGSKANQIDLSRPWPGVQTNPIFPCVDYPTIFDRLDAAGLTWRYYTPGDTNNFETGVLGVKHLYDSGEAERHLAIPTESNLCHDIATGKLPTVSYVVNRGPLNDHGATGTNAGPMWIATIANMLGQSQYWKDTTMLVTWDDWGGWYDHVKPRIIDSYEYGFRVPLLAVSPWLRHAGIISHRRRDQTAILHYIETVFNLPSLGMLDAKTDDLSDLFVPLGTIERPLPYTPIPVPTPSSYFCNLPPVAEDDVDTE
jgi:phospholipase C